MALCAKEISKSYLRQREDSNIFCAVEPVDFMLEEGVITCLSGPSGSGKTTLLSMLAGILKPTAGTVSLDDTDLYSMNDRALSRFRCEHFGVIPQGQTALQSLTVLENVMLPCLLSGGRRDDALIARAEALLARVGIGELRDVMPRELSGGELRRMAIARALVHSPEIILADEPTADLDDDNTDIVLSVLREAADSGKAVLVVTHDRKVMDFADRVYHMYRGKIQAPDK